MVRLPLKYNDATIYIANNIYCYNICCYNMSYNIIMTNQDNGDGSDNGWAAATISAIFLPGLLGSTYMILMIMHDDHDNHNEYFDFDDFD